MHPLRRLPLLPAVLACALTTSPVLALTVPDDVPTLQAALDTGAEEILIRPGFYAETPRIDREVTIRALLADGSSDLPKFQGLILDDTHQGSSHSASVRISDVHFAGPVTNVFHLGMYSGPLSLMFERCVLDSGITDEGQTMGGQLGWSIKDCTIEGGVRLTRPQKMTLLGNRIRGPVAVECTDYGMNVQGNTVEGTGPLGLSIINSGDDARVLGNTVTGFDNGIRIHARGAQVRENRVERCSGTAVFVYADDEESLIRSNRIRGCGMGVFAVQHRAASVDSNLIEDCTSTAITMAGMENIAIRNVIRRSSFGIRATSGEHSAIHHNQVEDCTRDGISAVSDFCNLQENRVVRCGDSGISTVGDGVTVVGNRVLASGYGIRASGAFVSLERNVVGHCAHQGISVFCSHVDLRVISNTSYSNAGSGLSIRWSDSYEHKGIMPRVRSNISAFNIGHGLELDAPAGDTLDQACNDLFANRAGNLSSRFAASDDLDVDPIFCDMANDDVQLRSDSPLLNADCGLVGALGQGCDVTTPVLVSLFSAERIGEGVSLRWSLSDPTTAPALWIERAESASGPWFAIATIRVDHGDVIVETDAEAQADRAYWYRLVSEDGVLAGPIEITANAPEFALRSIAPNPASGPVRIELGLARRGRIEIGVFDALGRTVATLASGEWSAGRHVISWRAPRSLGPGVYWVGLRHSGGHESRRFTLCP